MADKPKAADVHVGKRLRERRTMLGITQQKLGQELGLTFQQVQKYERGANRIGASRLYQLCNILKVPPQYFFEGLLFGGEAGQGFADNEQTPFEHDAPLSREVLTLVKAFRRIQSDAARQGLIDLAKALASDGER